MKLVSNQISPNLTATDVLSAAFASGKNLDITFEQFFCTKNYLLANSGRTCLGIIADVVNPDKRKKIGLPAFICAVVATPFLERGYEIEWIDTDENGVIDANDFKAKAEKISLLVVPHIFGQSAPLKSVMEIAKDKDIFVVEDGAHLIRQLDPLYTPLADAQILSFGREKVISCVSGGALLWGDASPFASKFTEVVLVKPSLIWTLKHMTQPIIYSLSLFWWNLGGKIIPFIFRKLNWIPLAVTSQEKNGHENFPQTRMSLWQKKLLARQLTLFEKKNIHTQALALKWEEALKTLFPKTKIIRPINAFRVIMKGLDPKTKEKIMNLSGFHLRDWDGVPISPDGVNLKNFGYRLGQCPKAEHFAKNYITFPTNIRTQKSDINRFIQKITLEQSTSDLA